MCPEVCAVTCAQLRKLAQQWSLHPGGKLFTGSLECCVEMHHPKAVAVGLWHCALVLAAPQERSVLRVRCVLVEETKKRKTERLLSLRSLLQRHSAFGLRCACRAWVVGGLGGCQGVVVHSMSQHGCLQHAVAAVGL
jgi:hypothetical protein